MKDKTVVITGASRGIGKAIGLRLASAGATVVSIAKDANNQSAKDEFVAAGGRGLALDVDVCDAHAIEQSIDVVAEHFGGIDVLINNTSATYFTDTLHTTAEQFDALIATSVRAAFLLSKVCIPYLKQAENPHIINISPPLIMEDKWFKDHLGFTLSKYAMSMCTLGMAEEFKEAKIGINSLWPESTIATQTIKDHLTSKVYAGSRWPAIMGDAAFELIQRPSQECSGMFFTDESLLKASGVDDFTKYAVDTNTPLMQALFTLNENGYESINSEMFLSKSDYE